MMEREFNEDEINELAQILSSVDDNSDPNNPGGFSSSLDYNDNNNNTDRSSDTTIVVGESSSNRNNKRLKKFHSNNNNNNSNNQFDSDSTSICEEEIGGCGAEDEDDEDNNGDSEENLDEILFNLAMEELEESRLSQQSLMKCSNNSNFWSEYSGRQKVFHFEGHQGLQKEINVRGQITPMETFNMLMDNQVLQHIVTETNRFAQHHFAAKYPNFSTSVSKRLSKWQPTTLAEMRVFFGMVMWMNIVRIGSLSSYWSQQGISRQLVPVQKFSQRRFESLLKMIHFSHESTTDIRILQLGMIQPFIKLLQTRFQEIYSPGEEIVIQESFIPWTGTLKRSRLHLIIPRNKSYPYGLSQFKLCSPDGYTWAIQLYSGKSERGERESFRFAKNLICSELASSLLDQGRTLFVDNFYTSYELAKHLLSYRTHLVAMLSPNNSKNFKNNIPKDILLNRLNCDELIAKEEDSGIVVMKWNGGVRSGEQKILSTKHAPIVLSNSMMIQQQSKPVPIAIQEYNRAFKRVDRLTDQICTSQHVNTLNIGGTDIQWYQKLGIELVCGTTVVNAWIVYQHVNRSTISIKQFRENLAAELLQLQGHHSSAAPVPAPAAVAPPVVASSSTLTSSSPTTLKTNTVLLLPMTSQTQLKVPGTTTAQSATINTTTTNAARIPLGLRIGNSNLQNMPPTTTTTTVAFISNDLDFSSNSRIRRSHSLEPLKASGPCPFLVTNLKQKGYLQLANVIDDECVTCDQILNYLGDIVAIFEKKAMSLQASEKKILRSMAKSCDQHSSSSLSSLLTSNDRISSTLPDPSSIPFIPDPNSIYGQIKPFRIYLFPFEEFEINRSSYDLNNVADKLFGMFQEFFQIGIPPKFLKMVLACLLYKFPFLDDKSECGTEKLCEKVKNKYRYKAIKHQTQTKSEDDIKLVAEIENSSLKN